MGKKVVSILTSVFVLATLLTGCLPSGQKSSAPASSVPASSAPVSSAPASSSANKDAKIIKISNGVNDKHPIVIGENAVFKKIVEEKTNGRYKVEIFFSNQLGDDVKATESLRAGTLEACVASTAGLVGIIKELGIFDIPFLFPDEKVADTVLDGPVGQKISAVMPDKGLINLAWSEYGFRHLTNSKKEVKTPADLKGMKIRTMENPIHLAAWRAMGANPTPMSFSELFTALQQKSIDGQENPIATIYSSKFFEVNKYVTTTGHVYAPLMFLFSKKVWDTIPKEDQAIMIDAAKQTSEYIRKLNKETTKKNLEDIKKEGGIVTELTPEQKKPFQELTAPVWDLVAEKVGKDLVNDMKAEVAKASK